MTLSIWDGTLLADLMVPSPSTELVTLSYSIFLDQSLSYCVLWGNNSDMKMMHIYFSSLFLISCPFHLFSFFLLHFSHAPPSLVPPTINRCAIYLSVQVHRTGLCRCRTDLGVLPTDWTNWSLGPHTTFMWLPALVLERDPQLLLLIWLHLKVSAVDSAQF